MVVEIRLMMALVEEINKALIPDRASRRRRQTLSKVLNTLEAICEVSMVFREWVRDPKELLLQLGEMEEVNHKWGRKIQELLREV
jgi:hypothetical protein